MTSIASGINNLNLLFVLLIAFQVKHFLADFPLQFPYMLKKFNPGWEFVAPLALHCAVHALLTLLITLAVAPGLWYLAIVDFAIHFVMDRLKSGPRFLGRYKDSQSSSYWIAFGFDQMVHHLTHIYLIWVIIHHLP